MPSAARSRNPHPTDLACAQWECLEPLMPKPKSGTRKGGRPAADLRSPTYLRIEPCGSMTNFLGDPSSKTAYASTALSIVITSVLMTSLK